jgi:Putative Ig domain
MRRLGLAAAFALAGAALLGGCGGGSSTTITIEIIPPATGVSVDVGATQALNFTAALGDDTTSAGVTWKLSGTSCSGSGCGTLSNQDKLSVSYTPPTALPSSAALSVTLTATSAAQTSVTQTATITVEPLPTFTTTGCNPPIPAGVMTTCGLPGASNGRAYNQPIQMTGGVGPYTFTVTSSDPSPLSAVCLNLTVAQTSNTSTAIAGKPCNGGADPTAVSFTVQVTDSGGALPITQAYAMNIAPAPPLSITTPSLPAADLNTAYSQSVNVSGGVTPITWKIASGGLPPGLALDPGKGTITGIPAPGSDTGQSNPPCAPAVPGNYCFSVQVTDSAVIVNSPPPGNHNQTQTRAYEITVQKPSALSITTPAGPLTAGTTAAGYSASIQATGGVPSYSWSVIEGQLPPGLSLNGSNGNITGVPTVASANPYVFTVQVTDAEVAPQTQTAQFSIGISAGQDNNSLLHGSYSFIFRGFDSKGSVAIIGTLTSDSNGSVTGAEVINRVSGVAPANVSGTYTIDSNGTTGGTSGDGRGTMELTSTVGQQSTTYEYQLALQSDGSVQFIEDQAYPTSPAPTNPDTFATHGEGVMKPVIGAGFSASSFGGNYAFEFTGEDTNNKPDAMAGSVHADGTSGTLTSGRCDFNDAGSYGSQSISGNFSFGSSFGTAQFTFENPDPTIGQQVLNFEYVFVSNSDLYFIEIDSTGTANTPSLYRMSGEMILQQPNAVFGPNALSGEVVATGSGVDSNGDAVVSAGLLSSTVCDGNTQNALSWDQNDGGTISPLTLPESCTVNPTNGRVAFSWVQAAPPAPAVTPAFATAYLVAPGEGFLIGNDATATTGLLEQQTAVAPFGNSSVSGAYALGAPLIGEPGVDNLVGEMIADGAGGLTGTVDEADATGTSQTLDQPMAATISAIGANGRGTMTTTTNPVPTGYPKNWIFYIVSAGQIRAIPADTTNQHPQLIFLGPTTF